MKRLCDGCLLRLGLRWALSDAMESEVLLLPALRLVIAGARKNEPALSVSPLIAASRLIYKSRLADTKTDVFTGVGGSATHGLAEDLSRFCENEIIFIGTRAVVVDNMVFT